MYKSICTHVVQSISIHKVSHIATLSIWTQIGQLNNL